MFEKVYKGNITLKEIVEEIKKSKSIFMTVHTSPDGDAYGSLLAFYHMIQKYNRGHIKNEKDYIDIVMAIDDEAPKYMSYFSDSKIILNYKKDIEKLKNKNFDLFISLDCANEERYGDCINIKRQSKYSINIDHHISNTEHADFNYVEDICSTSELVYQFLELFDIKLTKAMAEYMYLGIINDTGNFRHDNVTSNTFYVCSKLLEAGANNHKIANIIFAVSINKIDLLGEVYKNKVIDKKNNFIYYYLSRENIKKLDISRDDTDGIAEILLKIENTELSLFLREEEDGLLKGSLRSNDKFNVNKMASIFNGGGHIKAAGFKTNLSKNEVLEKINEYLKKN